jgi:hypothetical protein
MTQFLINIVAFFVFAVLGSCTMCGWYVVTREKMLLEFWSRYWEKKDGDRYVRGKIAHMMSGCIKCYSSIYGSLIYWVGGYALMTITDVYIEFTWRLLVLWMMYMLTCACLNTIIIKKVL